MTTNTVFQLRRNAVSGTRPTTTTVAPGELAINTTDGILFSANSTVIFEIGANTTTIAVGNSTVRQTANSSGLFVTGTSVINANSTSDALRITQVGTGNALVVEDAANPDSSPFVISANGDVAIGTTTATARLDVVGAANIRTFETLATDNIGDQSLDSNYFDVNISGADTLTTSRSHNGIRVDVDSTATGGNTTNEHIVRGVYTTVDVTGPSSEIIGNYNTARALNSTGTVTNLYGAIHSAFPNPAVGGTVSAAFGSMNQAYAGAAGTTTTIYGSRSEAVIQTTATAGVTTAYGAFNEVEIDGNSLTNGYATRSAMNIDGGVTTNGFLYYGDYQGANSTNVLNAWGLYLTGATKNFISGNVGIGNTAPAYALRVQGDISLSGGIHANGSFGTAGQVLSSNGTGAYWFTAPTATSVRQTFTANASVNTTFTVTGGYTIGFVDVYKNGIKLINGTDVTVSSGSTVVLASPAVSGEVIDVVGALTGQLIGVTPDGIQTLSNKRIDSRVSTTASATSVTPDISSFDMYIFTALAAGLTINATTGGSPVNGSKLTFRFKDNGTARALTWTTSGSNSFRAIGITLPTTTTINKVTYVGCIYNSDESFWDVIAAVTQA